MTRREGGWRRGALVAVALAAGMLSGCHAPAAASAKLPGGGIGLLRARVAARLQQAPEQVALSIDPRVQAAVEAEVVHLSQEGATRAVVAVVLEATTARVLALGGFRQSAEEPDLPARVEYDPGSVMKSFSVAAALDRGAVKPDEMVVGAGHEGWVYGGQTISDAKPHGPMTLGDVLAFSSNVGTAQIFTKLGKEGLGEALRKFHLGDKPGVELPEAAAGRVPDVTKATDSVAASVAYGGSVAPSPLQIAAGYAVFAAGGVYRAPSMLRGPVAAGEPVLKPETAKRMLELLEGTVSRDDGTGREARIPGVRVAGKTGTWSLEGGSYADFVGIVPADEPRFVVLVGVDTTASGYTGGTIAAPAFARIARQLL